MITFRQLRFYARQIANHASIRHRHLSRHTSPLVTLWRVLVGVGDDVMWLLINARVG